MKCPVCQCTYFYVKDPENPYVFYNFSIKDGKAVYDSGVEASKAPAIEPDTFIFCTQCSWSGKFKDLSDEGSRQEGRSICRDAKNDFNLNLD